MTETIDQYIISEANGVEQRGKLMPCPFCGATPLPPVWVSIEKRYAVYCYTCEYFACRGATQEIARKAWNTRHENHC